MVEIGNAVLWNFAGLILFIIGLLSLFGLAQKNRPKIKPLLLMFLVIAGLIMFSVSALEFFKEDYLGCPIFKSGLVEDQQFVLVEWHPWRAQVRHQEGKYIKERFVAGLPKMMNGTRFFIHNGKICYGDSVPKLIPQASI